MSRKRITEILEMSMDFGGYEGLYKNFQSLRYSVENEDWEFLLSEYGRIYRL